MRVTTPPRNARRVCIAGLLTAALLLALVAAWPADAQAAAGADVPAQEIVLPLAAADEGGGGLSGAGASEWLPFAIALGPALLLIAGILWITFAIDRYEDSDPEE